MDTFLLLLDKFHIWNYVSLLILFIALITSVVKLTQDIQP